MTRLKEKWKSLPRVLAIPVFTLSEKTCEILFSCSGLARTMIRMFHRVWIATWRSKDDRMLLYCSTKNQLCFFMKVTDLFKADVCDVSQDTFHRVRPFPLAQRILLSPNDVEVVWDVISGVVLCLALAFTLEPGVDVVGSTSITCRFRYISFTDLLVSSSALKKTLTLTWYPCSRCRETPWSCLAQASQSVCSSFVEEVGRNPLFSGETQPKWNNVIISKWKE